MASSNRRRLTSSDATPNPPISLDEISEHMNILTLLDSVDENSDRFSPNTSHNLATTELQLHRMLSLRSQISTTSSDAQRHADASENDDAIEKSERELVERYSDWMGSQSFSNSQSRMIIHYGKISRCISLWNKAFANGIIPT